MLVGGLSLLFSQQGCYSLSRGYGVVVVVSQRNRKGVPAHICNLAVGNGVVRARPASSNVIREIVPFSQRVFCHSLALGFVAFLSVGSLQNQPNHDHWAMHDQRPA